MKLQRAMGALTVVCLTICLLAWPCAAQDVASVVGKGFVAGAGGKAAELRAVDKAKVDAVKQQAILLMGADDAKDSMDQLSKKVLPEAVDFIREAKVIQVMAEDGVTLATVMVKVDRDALKRVLISRGLLMEAMERPRVMLVPELDVDESGPEQPRAMTRRSRTRTGHGGAVLVSRARELKNVPAKSFQLIRTLLTRAMAEKHFDVVDAGQAAHVSRIYKRLREFRDPGTASGSVDSVAQQVAYNHNADILVLYKLMVHYNKPTPEMPRIKAVRDSVHIRAVRADTGQTLLADERDANGASEFDEYLAHKQAIEKIMVHGSRGEKGLSAYVVGEIERWWAEYLKTGRPITVNFYVQGDDAILLNKLVALLGKGSIPGVMSPPRQRRVINSEQTRETTAQYDLSYRGTLLSLQQALLEKVATVEVDEGFSLRDKYRINVDAFGDNITICLLDPSRQEIRKPKGVAGITGGVSAAGDGPQIPLQELAAGAGKASVLVRSFRKGAEGIQPLGHGSGFFVTTEGHVVTNFHVVDGGEKFYVEMAPAEEGQTSPQIDAKLIRTMPNRDLALLQVKLLRPEDANFEYLQLGRSANLRVGDSVVAIGSPFFAGLMNNVTVGIVSALNRGSEKHIVHTAPIFSGSSGGPLLNMQGEVVGVNVAMPTGQVTANVLVKGQPRKQQVGRVGISGFAYAIPAELAAELLR